MRDVETRKSFSIDRFTTRLEINGYILNPNDFVTILNLLTVLSKNY